MDWVEHGGGILGILRRHLSTLKAHMEGVTRGFAPWQDTETFPLRMLEKTHESTGHVVKSDLRSLGIGVLAAGLAVCTGAVSFTTAALLLLAMAVIPTWLTVRRMLAMRFMQQCWQKCYTDRRGQMFGTLNRAEHSLERAALFGRVQAGAVIGIGGLLALAFVGSSPLLGALLAAVSISGFFTWKWSNRFAHEAHLAKVALRNRMRAGQPVLELCDMAGTTLVEKRSRYSQADTDFNPYLFTADGEVNEAEFERACRQYAPGRDYLTAYDLHRMNEGTAVREGKEGHGSWWSRLCKQFSNNRKADRLVDDYADCVVEEDRQLVPAVSIVMLKAILQGKAQANLQRELVEGDCA
jgi:hypothetical protein